MIINIIIRIVCFVQQSQPVENSGSSTSSSGSGGGGGNYGTLGRGGGGGMASMMDEMAKTLARRRAAVEKNKPEQPPVELFLFTNKCEAYRIILDDLKRNFFFIGTGKLAR